MFQQALPICLTTYDLVPPIELFALPHQGKNNTLTGLHTGAGDFIWKEYTSPSYEDPASISYEHHLLRQLTAVGLSFAVPVPLTTQEGKWLSQGIYGWAALEPHLSGTPLDPVRLDQVELLGQVLGELQTVLQTYPLTSRPDRSLFGSLFDFPLPVCDPFTVTPRQLGLAESPANDALLDWWREEAAGLQAFVAGLYQTLPWQLCHNDVTPGNVLEVNGRASAVLDFEFAAPAARALDVATGLRMTMRYWENPEPWEAIRHFCQGYTRYISLSESEILALPWLIRLRSALPTLWWMGRTDLRRDPSRVPLSIGYQQEWTHWLDHHEIQFLEVLLEALTTASPPTDQ